MYLLDQFLQPAFKEICINSMIIDEAIVQLEVWCICKHLISLKIAGTDYLQKIKNTTQESPFEGLDDTSGSVMWQDLFHYFQQILEVTARSGHFRMQGRIWRQMHGVLRGLCLGLLWGCFSGLKPIRPSSRISSDHNVYHLLHRYSTRN